SIGVSAHWRFGLSIGPTSGFARSEESPLSPWSRLDGESGLWTYTPSKRRTNAAMRLGACSLNSSVCGSMVDADQHDGEKERGENGHRSDDDEHRKHQLPATSATTWST